jgi:SAM-dependent methyltransferase
MMLLEHLGPILQRTRHLPHVLDAGGAYGPLNTATHILDIVPNRVAGAPLSSEEPFRSPPPVHVIHDMCVKPWPFADRFFDYSFCVQTLEDVRDPVGACEELMRVSKAGYIEVPSRLRESLHAKPGYFWRRVIGRPIRIGYGHHRWLCEAEPGGLTFTVKPGTLAYSRKYFITREEVGRDLTAQEANIGFFWADRFEVSERIMIEPGETEADFMRFKQTALSKIRR